MKRFYPVLLMAVFVFQNPAHLFSQNSYDQVYQLLNAHCANAGCHDGSTALFNVTVSPDSLYTTLMNAPLANATAVTKKNKLVIPGDMARSFLLRKIAHGISDGLAIDANEGAAEPNGLAKLEDFQIELVRQWILHASPKTGNVVDTSLINSYYRNGGIDDTYNPHPAPAAGTGFQIYAGRIFMRPNTEDEYFIKYDAKNSGPIEVNKVVTMMPSVDHHFGIWVFQNQLLADQYAWGIRPLAQGSMENVQYGIGTAAGLWNYTLPTGSAFYYGANSKFDLDLHIQNPSTDSILSVDLYANMYTQPVGTATKYMLAENFVNLDIDIPQDGQPHVFNVLGIDSNMTNYWDIWKLYTHTHKYGTAFNVWLRNPDGTKGAQVYDGNYSYEQGFDVGYYRNGPHVTFRTFPDDSLLEVNPYIGLIGEATWINTSGPNPVVWGFSSADEMMDIGFFYTPGRELTQATGISTPAQNKERVNVFPNPVSDQFVVSYELSAAQSVQIDVIDVLGHKVSTLVQNAQQDAGTYTREFSAADSHLSPGIYFARFTIGAKETTAKFIVTE